MRNLIDGFMNEHNRFGSISFLLIFVAVLGGVAAGFHMGSWAAMGVIVGVTMLTEALILAVQPMKRIVLMSFVASVVNLGFIIAGLF